MDQKIPVELIRKGMVVVDLDRPWSEINLPFQGFRISNDDEIETIKKSCQFVYIDLAEEKRLNEQVNDVILQKKIILPSTSGTPDKEHIMLFSRKVPVNELCPGMFVESLGVPWLSTDYSFQGFMITKEEEIKKLQELSEFVYVDALNSTYQFPPQEEELLKLAKVSKVIEIENKQDYYNTVKTEFEIKAAQNIIIDTNAIMSDVYSSIKRDESINLEPLKLATLNIMNSVLRNSDALVWLARLKEISEYSFSHAVNVSIYMLTFGRHIGYSKEQLMTLGMAGLLLDIGIVKLPKEIFENNRELNEEQTKLYHQHVNYSIDILRQSKDVPDEVLTIIQHHHEQYDGAGYPNQLNKENIGLMSFVAAICDYYDEMTNHARSHERVKSSYEALCLLYRLRNSRYPAVIVEQYIECIGVFNVGSIVELNSGEVGVVIEQNQMRRLQPRVMLLLNEEKEFYKDPKILDIALETTNLLGEVYKIIKVLPPNIYGINPKELFLT